MKLSVTILSFNEEYNIAKAVKSVAFADEIIVIDSFSQDRTVEIAEQLGAKVVQKEWMGYGQQKNYAASLCTHDWVLNLDADEQVTPVLEKAIKEVLQNPQADIYEINRLTRFCGQDIKHGGWFPDWIPRFYNRQDAHWTEPEVHEKLVLKVDGQIKRLNGLMTHDSFHTVMDQINTNVKYARLGAMDLIERKGRPSFMAVLIRPFWKFIECYFIKLGLLDGKAGLIIALNAAYSMFMKYSLAYTENGNSDD